MATTAKKLTSALFENKGRNEMIHILNDTIEEKNTYTVLNTADFKKIHLCVLEEIYLRMLDENKRYFLNKLEIYNLNKKLR